MGSGSMGSPRRAVRVIALAALAALVALLGPRESLATSECHTFIYIPPESPFQGGAVTVPVGSPVWVGTGGTCEDEVECTFRRTAGGEAIVAEVLRTGCSDFFTLPYAWLVPEIPWVAGETYTVSCSSGLLSPQRFVVEDRPPAAPPRLASVEVQREPGLGCCAQPEFTFAAELEGQSLAEFTQEGGLFEIAFGDGSLVYVAPEDLEWVQLAPIDGDVTVTAIPLSATELDSVTVPEGAILRGGACTIGLDGRDGLFALWLLAPLLWLRLARRRRRPVRRSGIASRS